MQSKRTHEKHLCQVSGTLRLGPIPGQTLFEIRTPLDGRGAPLTKILQALL